MPEVSVIIPARNAATTLAAALEAVKREAPAQLIVVDDGSSDATADIARAAGATVVAGPGTGPGAARNAGAAVASADALVFLDADCVPVRGWLEAGLQALADADLVQGRVDPDPTAARYPFERTLYVPAAYGLFESANLFVRRELFDRLGGFEDWLPGPEVRFGPARVGEKSLGEDVLFGWRALRDGATTDFADEALVHHAVFDRTALEYVAERLRLRSFPKLARRVPELRESFFYGGVFLTRRSASFDAAAAGLALALITRRRLPLAAALPYAVLLRRHVRRWPQAPAAQVAATYALADAVGLYALARGSAEARTVVL